MSTTNITYADADHSHQLAVASYERLQGRLARAIPGTDDHADLGRRVATAYRIVLRTARIRARAI